MTRRGLYDPPALPGDPRPMPAWCGFALVAVLVALAAMAMPADGGIVDDPDAVTSGEYTGGMLACRERGGEWVILEGAGHCIIDSPEPIGSIVRSITEGMPHIRNGGTLRIVDPGSWVGEGEWNVSWISYGTTAILYSCTDSIKECAETIDDLCDEAGHGGAKKSTVPKIKNRPDGSKLCIGDCNQHGAIAFCETRPPEPQPKPDPQPDPDQLGGIACGSRATYDDCVECKVDPCESWWDLDCDVMTPEQAASECYEEQCVCDGPCTAVECRPGCPTCICRNGREAPGC